MDTDKKITAHWVIADDHEYFVAYCSRCKRVIDSRQMPKKCPKCKSRMLFAVKK